MYKRDGKKLITKLKSRRDGLLRHAMKYYEELSHTVTINGSDGEEMFEASGDGKKLKIAVYRLEKEGTRQKIYERTFDPSDTRAIHLQGFRGNDQFIINETANTGIRLKVFGNEGKDIYNVRGSTKSRIIDAESENNVVLGNSTARIQFR